MPFAAATALLLAAASFRTLGVKQFFVYDEPSPDAKAVPLAQPAGLVATPIHFASGARGALTNRIVIGVDDLGFEAALAAVRALPDFLSDEPLAFHEHTRTAIFRSPTSALAAANALIGKRGVRYAHPDFKLAIEARSAPEAEPLFYRQWHLSNTGQTGGKPGADIGALAAWEETRGQRETLVAMIDLGFEQAHPDLTAAWHVNTAEIPGNRVDDDGNGLKDDVAGWNFAIDGANLIYGAAAGHGTCTSGIVGARANGTGVSGICPECGLLPIVIDDMPSNAAKAFKYAQSFGAAVVSNSWGYHVGTPQTDVVVEAIADLAKNGRGGKGASIVFAMSNGHLDDCRNHDISGLPSVVAVSSVDHTDRRVESSGYGSCLKLLAPSSATQDAGIATVDRPGIKGYNAGDRAGDFADLDYTNTFYGTSAAAPQVAGAFALLYSAHPELSAADALRRLTDAADKVDAERAAYDPATGLSATHGFGRVNIGKALH